MRIWRATAFGDPQEVLKQVELELPKLADNEFKIRVLASGVGLPDYFMVKGGYPLVPKPPASPGQEVVGVVTEVGSKAAYEVGDRVVTATRFSRGFGGFAQEVIVSAKDRLSCIAPAVFSDEQAAGFLIPYHTGYYGLVRRGRMKASDTVLVLGGPGSSGSAAIQIAKAVGAKVIAVAGTDEKEEFCKRLGADETINYRKGSIHGQALKLTDNRGVDIIYDPVGGAPAADALEAITHNGRLVLIGFAAGAWAKVSASHIVQKNYDVIGAFMGHHTPAEIREAQTALETWAEKGIVAPPIDKVFQFNQVPDLMKRLEKGEMLGKMVLRVSE